MSSILTNSSAMTALQSLNMTMASMKTTQSQISTGLRISSAADNAAYWSIATTMKQDSSALSTVSDALSLGASSMSVANNGLTSAIDVVGQIKNALASASQPGIDRTKIQSQITNLQAQLKSIADTSSFDGQNFLSVDSGAANYNSTKSFISSYSHDSAGNISVGSINLDTSNVSLFDPDTGGAGAKGILDKVDTTTSGSYTDASGTTTNTAAGGTGVSLSNLSISALTDSAGDMATLNALTKQVEGALSAMTSAASNLGSAQARITSQQSFVTALKSTIDQGVGSLVDADMNAASTRLQALQVQQQLGVQSLSIANQSSQLILKLFG
jgi:flagellin